MYRTATGLSGGRVSEKPGSRWLYVCGGRHGFIAGQPNPCVAPLLAQAHGERGGSAVLIVVKLYFVGNGCNNPKIPCILVVKIQLQQEPRQNPRNLSPSNFRALLEGLAFMISAWMSGCFLKRWCSMPEVPEPPLPGVDSTWVYDAPHLRTCMQSGGYRK